MLVSSADHLTKVERSVIFKKSSQRCHYMTPNIQWNSNSNYVIIHMAFDELTSRPQRPWLSHPHRRGSTIFVSHRKGNERQQARRGCGFPRRAMVWDFSTRVPDVAGFNETLPEGKTKTFIGDGQPAIRC